MSEQTQYQQQHAQHAWRNRRCQITPRQQFRLICDTAVSQAFIEAKLRYGAPRLADELQEYNIKTIAASLRRQGLWAKASRKFSPVSYREHGLLVSENLLKQDFTASGPNQKWAGDIIYLRTDEGWLYLAVVIDLWSRAVIGWSMSARMTAQLACNALKMALWRHKRPENVIVHTDQGSQYCSVIFSDFFLFDDVAFVTDRTQEQVEHLLDLLKLSYKVSFHNGRFSTVALSQGQRKRLALLQSWLEDRPIYLFDEWAADQDPEFKAVFYLELLPMLKAEGKTVIAITHDDRYFHLADRLINLESGQIVEHTSPPE
ncbi:DDE-type integrase/transposase/recombinase [Salmonella enterica]|nr:DDE-type integrase/transposase/recombinase [Salmonella enterica]